MNWLEEALKISGDGDRARDYGTSYLNFARTAAMWSIWLRHPITIRDVGVMMILMKISRERQTHKDDNFIDIAGYINALQTAYDNLSSPEIENADAIDLLGDMELLYDDKNI